MEAPFRFEELVKPLRLAFKHCYSMRRKNRGLDVPWKGPDVGGACYFAPSEAFKAENLAYSEEDQGRDALDELIAVALQLGIEQGRRIEAEKYEFWKNMTDTLLEVLKSQGGTDAKSK